MKKGKLSIAEEFYIKNSGKEKSEIAKDLDRSIKVVEKYLDKATVKENINKFIASKDGAYVMTQGGSERGDDIPKRSKNSTNKANNAIFRPLD